MMDFIEIYGILIIGIDEYLILLKNDELLWVM